MDSIEKPQAGALDISVVTAELGARATELLLLRAYAQQLSEAFDQQADVIAELRAEVARLGGEPRVHAVSRTQSVGFNAVTDTSLMESTG
jgi:hypothetical protein